MRTSPRRPLAVGTAFALTAVMVVSDIVLRVANGDRFETFGFPGTSAIALLISGVGAVVALRSPAPVVGRLLMAAAALLALTSLGQDYGVRGLAIDPGSLPAASVLAWLGTWCWVPGLGIFAAIVPLYFPDGRLVSSRWRPGLWFAWSSIAAASAVGAAAGWPPAERAVAGATEPRGGPLAALFEDLSGLVVAAVFVGAASAIARYRQASGDQRRQLKWLAYSVSLVMSALLVQVLAAGSGSVVPQYLLVAATATVPVAIGIAILRYRLYDIEVVIHRSVVFGLLAAFITAVYVSVVVVIGRALGTDMRRNRALSILAMAVVAVAFQWVREHAQRLANRLVYGERVTPLEAVSGFSERVAVSYDSSDVLTRMARVIAEATGASAADVWLRVGGELEHRASWPENSARSLPRMPAEVTAFTGVARAVEVRHRDELLGVLTIAKRPGEQVTATEDELLHALASQAGLVLRNIGLTADLAAHLEEIALKTEELRASRERIVAAQDVERRKIERDIHDGAQQHLVALAVQLGLAKQLATSDPSAAKAMVEELRGVAADALTTLRELSRGIYPPMLVEQGLERTLRAQLDQSSVAATVEVERLGRYAPDVEAAVYFTCMEAVQNAAKHAAGHPVTIYLGERDGELTFRVDDEGPGFDRGASVRGSGLTNMADRIGALGGRLVVESTPGRGTSVRGAVPVEQPQRVAS